MKRVAYAVVAILSCALVARTEAALLIETPGAETTIEGWLGQDNLDFDAIFIKAKDDGLTAFDFHTAIFEHGQGPTIVLFEILSTEVRSIFFPNTPSTSVPLSVIVGGYNPQVWSSTAGFRVTEDDEYRDAFLFNLNSGVKLDQKLSADPNGSAGKFQTYNSSTLGPSFGGSGDLEAYGDLSSGRVLRSSYGLGFYDQPHTSLLGMNLPANSFEHVTYGRIEVYTFGPAMSSVPEPASLALWGLGGLGLVVGGAYRRFRGKKSEALAA